METSPPKEVTERERLLALEQELEAAERERLRNGLDKVYLCPKHLEFFDLESRIQAAIGANRSGKTHSCGAYKVLRLCEGTHLAQLAGRFQKPPLKGRICANDFSVLEMVIVQKLRELKPDDWKYEYDKRNHIIYITNAKDETSIIFLNTYDQETTKHAGVDLDFVWCDEEPTESIYKENRMRLLDRGGWTILTFTADQCTPWSFEMFKKSRKTRDPNIKIVNISIWDNVDKQGRQRIPEDEIQAIARGLSKAERRIKLYGEIASLSGLVWPEFREDKHVKEIDMRGDWTRYMGIDYHMRNDVYCLYLAINPEGKKVVYDEVALGGTVKDIADALKEREGGDVMFQRVIDSLSATPERGGTVETCAKQELINEGIVCISACKDKVGFNLVREWLQGDDFFVLPKCVGFIDQILSYQYEDFARRKELKNPKEEVRKLDDDYMDILKYIANYRPFYSNPHSLKEPEFVSPSKTGYVYARS